MPSTDRDPRTFVEMVLTLLEDRFPWLGSENEEASGADTVEELANLYEELLERRNHRQQSTLGESGEDRPRLSSGARVN